MTILSCSPRTLISDSKYIEHTSYRNRHCKYIESVNDEIGMDIFDLFKATYGKSIKLKSSQTNFNIKDITIFMIYSFSRRKGIGWATKVAF